MTPHPYNRVYPLFSFLNVVFIFILSNKGQTQNVLNDTLFVNTENIVELIFKEPSSGEIPNGDGSYEIRGGTNTSLLIRAKKKEAKAQPLIVIEGSREHKFILVYRANAMAARLDYSNLEKIAEKQKKEPSNTASKEAVVVEKDDGGRRPSRVEREKIQVALKQGNDFFAKKQWDSSLARYRPIVQFKFNERKLVQQRIKEIEAVKAKELAEREKMFAEAIAKADEHAGVKNFIAEEQSLKYALTIKPGDMAVQERLADLKPKVVLQLQEQNALKAKERITMGDLAAKAKKFLEADIHFESAQKLDPANTLIAPKRKRIKPFVAEERFKIARVLGDSLFKANNYVLAQDAYEEALFYKSPNSYVAGQLQKIRQHNRLQLQRKYYQEAITIADKARDGKEYQKAISEYQRANRIFPDSTYPGKQIQYINQVQKEQSNKSTEKDAKVKANSGKPT